MAEWAHQVKEVDMSISVTVSGMAAEGKTTVASIIAHALNEAGFSVNFLDDNGTCIVEEMEPIEGKRMIDCTAALIKKELHVGIRTQSVLKSGH